MRTRHLTPARNVSPFAQRYIESPEGIRARQVANDALGARQAAVKAGRAPRLYTSLGGLLPGMRSMSSKLDDYEALRRNDNRATCEACGQTLGIAPADSCRFPAHSNGSAPCFGQFRMITAQGLKRSEHRDHLRRST